MSYKTILAYLPSDEAAKRILDCVLPIAQEHNAHLIGLHVLPRVPVMYGVVAAEIPQSVVVEQEAQLARHADQLEEMFRTRCDREDVNAEWRCNKVHYEDTTAEVVSQALCSDLVVVQQQRDSYFGTAGDMPSRIVMESGRPVLIIPHTGDFSTIGNRVVVAWNGSREAARAAYDAVPLMQNAKSVRVLSINPKCREGYDSIALGDETALSLARHNIKAEVTVAKSADVPVGDELLNRLAEDGCDLLVMGCYGHSRLRETLFGGVTQNLMQHMTAPVLMSH